MLRKLLIPGAEQALDQPQLADVGLDGSGSASGGLILGHHLIGRGHDTHGSAGYPLGAGARLPPLLLDDED